MAFALCGLFVGPYREQFAPNFLPGTCLVGFSWRGVGHLPFKDVLNLKGRVKGGLWVGAFVGWLATHIEEVCLFEDHTEGMVVLDYDTGGVCEGTDFQEDRVEESWGQ